jgi:hypothetical protein
MMKPRMNKLFEVGQVWKMNVANRSHVKHPYFVEIISVDDNGMTIGIPGEHTTEIKNNSPECDYHIPRMECVGTKETYGHLLLNQSFEKN